MILKAGDFSVILAHRTALPSHIGRNDTEAGSYGDLAAGV